MGFKRSAGLACRTSLAWLYHRRFGGTETNNAQASGGIWMTAADQAWAGARLGPSTLRALLVLIRVKPGFVVLMGLVQVPACFTSRWGFRGLCDATFGRDQEWTWALGLGLYFCFLCVNILDSVP